MNKALRIFGVSLALALLVIFATVVVSDFDCHNAADDAHCPYCHLTHQAPPDPEITQVVSAVGLIAYLPLPQDIILAAGPVFSQTAPRAPPV